MVFEPASWHSNEKAPPAWVAPFQGITLIMGTQAHAAPENSGGRVDQPKPLLPPQADSNKQMETSVRTVGIFIGFSRSSDQKW